MNALGTSPLKAEQIKILKESLNPQDFSNYNITSKSINASKGQVFKAYRCDKSYAGMGILPIALGLKCERYIRPIAAAVDQAMPIVQGYLAETRRETYVTGNADLERVAEELEKFHLGMLVNLDEPRQLRSRKG